MMCVLKLWYTLFAFFVLALLLIISLRRRFFCRSICPLGAVQDFAGKVKQFWSDVIWSNINYMFVDMPPGTGDVSLTGFQSIAVYGIIIVTHHRSLLNGCLKVS